jgi:osmoprotectant transport system substrate-binding protein
MFSSPDHAVRVPRKASGAALGAVVAVVSLAAAACGSSGGTASGGGSSNPLAPGGSKGTVVVGSANFPEDELLAEIYIQALQGKGIKVTPKLNIGSREVYYPQIKNGTITILPEYNGALLLTSVDTSSTAATTSAVDAALKAKLPASLEILNPAPAQDKDSVTVTQATARKYHLKSISDLKPVAKKMVIGAPPEFKTRAEGLVGLEKVYGLHFKSFVPLDESGPITLRALITGKAQAADVFTTTPQIITDHLLSLADPKSLFAAQNVTPLVYRKGVNPAIVSALNAVSAKLTTAALLSMDKQIILDHANYSTVAANWLKQQGLS